MYGRLRPIFEHLNHISAVHVHACFTFKLCQAILNLY